MIVSAERTGKGQGIATGQGEGGFARSTLSENAGPMAQYCVPRHPLRLYSPCPPYYKAVTSCFFGKRFDRTCCKPPDVKKLEKPQIAQIFADSEARKKREPGPTLSVVSCLFFNG
jgi:hypothetical protein